ncbi:hypothetical protein ACH41H_20690 [Streptomyces sp. NPDC020800]|uniref:hypothetical protein n=1 Tax=Streptomyces sp. NPDC020800 TaxID=3365092 RepID=UPI00379AB1F6
MNRRIATLSGVFCAALLLTACSSSDSGVTVSRTSSSGSTWDKKAGAPEAASFMRLRVPPGATAVKGAVRVNPQEDTYLLSFVTAQATAEQLATELHFDHPLSTTEKSGLGGSLFKHLGLTDPEKLNGVRWSGVCPPCVVKHGRGRVQWIEMFVHAEGKGRARVYLQAF